MGGARRGRWGDEPTCLPDGRPLARSADDLCDDAFCVVQAGHDGDHDPSFDRDPTAEEDARREAEEARQARLLAHAPMLDVESTEQLGLFGGA